LVAYFYFVLIFGFGSGLEIAVLSLAMTGFFEVTLGFIFYFVLIFGFGSGLSFDYAQDDIVVLEMDKIGDFRFLTGFFASL